MSAEAWISLAALGVTVTITLCGAFWKYYQARRRANKLRWKTVENTLKTLERRQTDIEQQVANTVGTTNEALGQLTRRVNGQDESLKVLTLIHSQLQHVQESVHETREQVSSLIDGIVRGALNGKNV